MLAQPALQAALRTVPLTVLGGPWYRAVNYDHLRGGPPGSPSGAPAQPLWSGGAARFGARFTPKAASGTSGAVAAINAVYCAEDELTPLMEIAGVLRPAGSMVALVFVPQVLLTLTGAISDILDLTDTALHPVLGTSHQELTGAWARQQSTYLTGQGPMPPTQQLGAEAFASGRIVGLRYPSSKHPGGVGVVVFPARLVLGRHQVRVFNPAGTLQQTLP
jgi:RES domain-containing protein